MRRKKSPKCIAERAPCAQPPRRGTWLGRYFGVYADPRAYTSLFYMLLALATGIFYFSWAVTGFSLSLGLMITIFGLPLAIIFIGSTRLLSLVEGRIVETLLGVRMPRRPIYPANPESGVIERIKAMLTDVRTWSTMLYMLLMLPLGIAYFVFSFTTLTVAATLVLTPLAVLFGWDADVIYWNGPVVLGGWDIVFYPLIGILLLTVSMHIYRGIGKLQGHIAHGLLVKVAAR